MHEIIDIIVNFVGELGYTGIFFMMVLESSFFPFPSEVAMIPAGYLASIGQMNFAIAFLAGTAGALIGASINYILWYKLWAPIIKTLINKYWKYFLIKIEHYERTEIYFQKHWVITTFLARFVTVIRQLISLPAGVFKMNFAKFLFYTWLGAGWWNLLLMWVGYVAWETWNLVIAGILFVVIIGTIYYFVHKNKKK